MAINPESFTLPKNKMSHSSLTLPYLPISERVRKLLRPDFRLLEPGESMEDALLGIIGIVNNDSFHIDQANETNIPDSEPTDMMTREVEMAHGSSYHNDLFLDALLRPDEHLLQLSNIRSQVALKCQVLRICYQLFDQVPVDLERCRDLLQCTVQSLHLLQRSGLAQTSLILLADDLTRSGDIQSIELKISDLEAIAQGWVSGTGDQQIRPSRELCKAAEELLRTFAHTPESQLAI